MEMCSKFKQTLMSESFQIKHLSTQLHVGRLLMIIFLIFSITEASAQGSQSTCAAPPAFNGSTTTLTCIFPEHFAERKFNVYVTHYVKDILLYEIVLICKSSNGTFSCSGIPDYQFIKFEKDTVSGKFKLIAQISEVNHRHAGKYCCDFSWFGEAQDNKCEECTLEVNVFKDNLSAAENSTLKGITENEAISFIFPLTVVLGIILPIVIVVITIIVILKFVCLKKRRKRKAMNTDKSNSEQDGHLLDVQNKINQTLEGIHLKKLNPFT